MDKKAKKILKRILKANRVEVDVKIADPTFGDIAEVKFRGKTSKFRLNSNSSSSSRTN